MVLATPRRFRIFSLFVLVVILALQVYGIDQLASRIPSPIDIDDSRIILQSVIALDGVLLGFGAIVLATIISREATFSRVSYIVGSMIVTVAAFLVSLLQCFYSLATMFDGLTPTSLSRSLAFSIVAITLLFFTVYVYLARDHLLADK